MNNTMNKSNYFKPLTPQEKRRMLAIQRAKIRQDKFVKRVINTGRHGLNKKTQHLNIKINKTINKKFYITILN